MNCSLNVTIAVFYFASLIKYNPGELLQGPNRHARNHEALINWIGGLAEGRPGCLGRSHWHWCLFLNGDTHYCDVILSTMASLITSLTSVYSIVHSGAYQTRHQSSATLVFVWRIYWWPVNSLHKGPVARKSTYLMTLILHRRSLDICYKILWNWYLVCLFVEPLYRLSGIRWFMNVCTFPLSLRRWLLSAQLNKCKA